MVYAHVIYKKTGIERQTTIKAYNLLKNQYTLLGYVDENGNPVEGPEERSQARVKTQKKSAGPAVSRMSPEEIEAKKAELRELNRVTIQKAMDEQAKEKGIFANVKIDPTQEVLLIEHSTVKQRKKPGPKPKTHA